MNVTTCTSENQKRLLVTIARRFKDAYLFRSFILFGMTGFYNFWNWWYTVKRRWNSQSNTASVKAQKVTLRLNMRTNSIRVYQYFCPRWDSNSPAIAMQSETYNPAVLCPRYKTYNKSSAVAEMGNRFATKSRHRPRFTEAGCPAYVRKLRTVFGVPVLQKPRPLHSKLIRAP